MIGRSLLQRWSRRPPENFLSTEAEFVEAVARSHVGKVRQINEDRFLMRSEHRLWAVADGMGGHAGGSAAANAAIEELAGVADSGQMICEAAICAAFDRANRRIHAGASDKNAMSGTTMVVAWLTRDELKVFWVGDSRAYHMRNRVVRCLTRDHSVVQELLDAGEISEAEAERHPYSNLVTRALGASQAVAVDRIVVDVKPGDRLLLCSDGVSRSIDLVGVANGSQAVSQFADDVLRDALRRDGSDNATLIAVQLNALPPI
jgi:serine/threonine-protein phosphatase Stp1